MDERPDPAVLAEAVKGLSDDELKAQISGLGTDLVLTQIFEGMRDAFDPGRAGSTSAVIQYEISTDEGQKQWIVEIADGGCSVREGAAESPRLTLSLALQDFVRLIFNQVEGPQLFMSGKLKLKGDMMFAMTMQGFFKRDF
ncbi:MAG TPA: SCP2 sterol-binding domain-containing protein [Actinomycetota bacterium]|nr:SCP2 sterol-binding domain-containing protein [Actinomycetota bacterium]